MIITYLQKVSKKNIDWEALNAEIIHVCYNGTSAIEAMKKRACRSDHF